MNGIPIEGVQIPMVGGQDVQQVEVTMKADSMMLNDFKK